MSRKREEEERQEEADGSRGGKRKDELIREMPSLSQHGVMKERE